MSEEDTNLVREDGLTTYDTDYINKFIDESLIESAAKGWKMAAEIHDKSLGQVYIKPIDLWEETKEYVPYYGSAEFKDVVRVLCEKIRDPDSLLTFDGEAYRRLGQLVEAWFPNELTQEEKFNIAFKSNFLIERKARIKDQQAKEVEKEVRDTFDLLNQRYAGKVGENEVYDTENGKFYITPQGRMMSEATFLSEKS